MEAGSGYLSSGSFSPDYGLYLHEVHYRHVPLPPLAPAETCTELATRGTGLQVTGPTNRFRDCLEESPGLSHKDS